MNISRRYSISVCFVYSLEEKDSKSEVILAVCRLPLTSCLTSLIIQKNVTLKRIQKNLKLAAIYEKGLFRSVYVSTMYTYLQ